MVRSHGFTLIELCLLLALFAVLSSLAVPSLSRAVAGARARGALARLSADIYLARSLAVRSGEAVRVRFEPAEGCAQRYLIESDRGTQLKRVELGADGVCLSSNVARPMFVNRRGMLSGSQRRLMASSGSVADTAVVSIVGRVIRGR